MQVMLLGFILLGRSLEERARLKASSDMNELLVSFKFLTVAFKPVERFLLLRDVIIVISLHGLVTLMQHESLLISSILCLSLYFDSC